MVHGWTGARLAGHGDEAQRTSTEAPATWRSSGIHTFIYVVMPTSTLVLVYARLTGAQG